MIRAQLTSHLRLPIVVLHRHHVHVLFLFLTLQARIYQFSLGLGLTANPLSVTMGFFSQGKLVQCLCFFLCGLIILRLKARNELSLQSSLLFKLYDHKVLSLKL